MPQASLGPATVLEQRGAVPGSAPFRPAALPRFASPGHPLVAERIIKASLLLPASQEVRNRLAVLARVTRPGSVSNARNQLPPGVAGHRDVSGNINSDNARISNAGGQKNSGGDDSDTGATLPLPAESAGQGLAGACSFDGLSVGVEFTEPVDLASATAKENYSVSGSTVTNVTLGADEKPVVLWLSTKLAGDFSVAVQHVKNSRGQPVAGSSIGGTALNLQLQDLDTGQPCSVLYQGGVAQIVAGGENIWEKADHFVYEFTKMTGDFDYRLRIQSISSAAEIYARTGLMTRDSFSAHGAREVMVAVNAEN